MSANPSLGTILSAWSWHPLALLAVIVCGWVYLRGLRHLASQGELWSTITAWHVTSFAAGLLSLVIALDSPIDILGNYLLSMHMVQVLFLLVVTPVLLLLGKPVEILVAGTPDTVVRNVEQVYGQTPWLQSLLHRLTAPVESWILYAGSMLLWYPTVLYQATLRHQSVHALENLSYFGAGLLFWWVAIEPVPGPPRLHHGLRILYTWLMTFPVTAVGALLTLINSERVVYPLYNTVPHLWGSTVLGDQQFAGVVLWLGGGMVYIVAASVLFFVMMAEDERRALKLVDDTPEADD